MTWFTEDNTYFDFGPTDAVNTGRWAEWTVKLKYPGKYNVLEKSYCDNGHTWQLDLIKGESVIASYTSADRYWGIGYQDYTQKEKWDLSSTGADVYTLRIHNATSWGRPKLKSITLDYDGVIPTAIEQVSVEGPGICGPADMRVYDLCGREVTASKDHLGRGIFIVVTGGHTGKVMIP